LKEVGMNRWLLGVLAISLAANLWLVATRSSSAPPAPPRGLEARPPAAPPTDVIAARVAALEAELATARAKAAEVEAAFDPIAWIVALRRPAIEKARLIAAIESETDRMTAAWNLGRALGESEASAAELLAAIENETDPAVLAVLAEILRAGGARKASTELRRRFAELLKTAALPLQRVAAVRGCWGGGSVDDEIVAGALCDALRSDPCPEVAGAAAEKLGRWPLPAGAMEALRAAADRLPAGPPRRSTYIALLWAASPLEDGGAEPFARFEAASSQDLKDDIADAFGRAANANWPAVPPRTAPTPAEVEARARVTHDRLLVLYRGSSELRTRQILARAAQFGGFVEAWRGVGLAALYRELAEVEPDPAQRDRLLRAADLDHGKIGSADVDRVLFGREE
jgi:hypothetical protein